ncbi:MAG: AtpZ/AtpI family protein [Alphaproteobacteria bacterium]|nr:AtpZ/AtpI family protein [Alphaproteobacteria bacterium]
MMKDERLIESDSSDIQNIAEKINSLKKKISSNSCDSGEHSSSIGGMLWISFNVVSDLIAGVFCGLLFGYGLDYVFNTKPVMIAIFLIMGCIAGMMNAIAFVKRFEQNNSDSTDKKVV